MFRGGGASSQSSQAAVPARVKLMRNISQSLFCKSTQSTALWGVQSRGKVTWYAKICQGSFYVIFINETCAISGRCVKGTALIETRQGMMRRWRKNGGRKRTRRRPCWIYSVNDFQTCGDFNNMSQTQAKTTFRSQKLAPGKLLVPLRKWSRTRRTSPLCSTTSLRLLSPASSATSKLCARCFSKTLKVVKCNAKIEKRAAGI